MTVMVNPDMRGRLRRSLARHSTAALAAFLVTTAVAVMLVAGASWWIPVAIIGFLIALAVAVAIPLLLDLGTPTFHTRRDVERLLQLPVVARRGRWKDSTATRRIFLAPASGVRSVLFCGTPGDRHVDVADEAADVLAAQSGQRVALVEHPASEHERGDRPHPLISRVAWGPLVDLYTTFSFVIVKATATTPEQFIPIARDVDGVVVVFTRDETQIDAAEMLVATLRRSGVNLIGAVLA